MAFFFLLLKSIEAMIGAYVTDDTIVKKDQLIIIAANLENPP